jgi:hypothetical protein
MNEYYIVVTIMFGFGIVSIYVGFRGLLGFQRKSYILPYEFGYVGSGVSYSMIPLGVAICMWSVFLVLPIPQESAIAAMNIFGLVAIIGILFGMFQPKFMQPKWYRWLMENHKDIMPWLREDVAMIGYDEWRQHTDTQEGLEAWVAEVREKNNL